MLRTFMFPLAFAAALAAAPAPGLAFSPFGGRTEVHGDPRIPLAPMAELELDAYAGRWYEIARFPNRYQRGCAAITAEYQPRADGHYDVSGICPDLRPGRRPTEATGVARLDGPGELSIGLTSWMPLFRRSVFVLDVSADYSVAVIGEPERKYGWIMARSPELDDARYAAGVEVLARNGYFVEMLERLPPAE